MDQRSDEALEAGERPEEGADEDPARRSPGEESWSDGTGASGEQGRARPVWRRVPWPVVLPVLIVAALVAVAVIAGGSENEGDRAAEEPEEALPSGWEIVEAPSGLEPLSLSVDPLWGTDAGGPLEVVSAAVFRDDVAVLLGGDDGNRTDQLAVVDAATATPRWSIGGLDELTGGDGAVWWLASDSPFSPNVVNQPDGWAVLVPYYYSPCPGWCHYTQVDQTAEYGVAALSAADGHVLWKTTVVPAAPMTDPPPETPTIRAMVTSEDLALVVVEPGDVEYAPHTQTYVDALRAIAIDPTSGSILWEVTGVWPKAVVGDSVLAHTGADPMRSRLGEDDQREGPALVALDASTGRTRWDLSERFRYSDLVLTAGEVALVEVPADGADDSIGDVPLQGVETLAIDLETGREVTSLGTEIGPCRTDQTSLVACSLRGPDGPGDDRVATFQLDDRDVGVSEARFDGLSIDDVWDGRVFVTAFDPPQPERPEFPDTGGMDRDEAEAAREEYWEALEEVDSWIPVERRWSVDTSGRTVDDTVPGTVLAASDRYVIFACGSIGNPCKGQTEGQGLDDRYAVYRLE
jgi:outer membrane protein assembly factor BamB